MANLQNFIKKARKNLTIDKEFAILHHTYLNDKRKIEKNKTYQKERKIYDIYCKNLIKLYRKYSAPVPLHHARSAHRGALVLEQLQQIQTAQQTNNHSVQHIEQELASESLTIYQDLYQFNCELYDDFDSIKKEFISTSRR